MKKMTALLLGACCAISAMAQQAAEVSVFAFRGGLPIPGLMVLVDGNEVARTNDNGAAFFSTSAEGHDITVVNPKGIELARMPVSLIAGENIQFIVNVGEGLVPQITVESSNKANEGKTVTTEPQEVVGDPGTLSGRVYSAESGEGVANARVFVSGTPLDLRTDQNGQYSVELPARTYSISIMHPDFATQTMDGVEVIAEDAVTVDVEVVPAGLELPEFVVLEPFVEGSLASVMEEQRTSTGVTNVLGADQISRSGDSDAAGALKRVTGLTLVDGQFIYVRGLGERYSTTSLNGASVPSPDPTRRVVPLDLFPASIISSVVVAKSYSAEIPAGFGGGAVGIRTKSIPQSPFLEFGLGSGYNDQTTFKEGLTYPGGGSDWDGFDDGTRELPEELRDALTSGRPFSRSNAFNPEGFTPEELEALGESLPNLYTPFEKDVGPDRSASLSGGYRWDFDSGLVLGFLASANYGDSWATRQEQRRNFRLSTVSESGLEVVDDFDVDITERTIDLSGFITVGAEFGENHAVNLTSSYLRLTEDQTQIQEGFLRDQGGDVRFTNLLWEERELLSLQAYGDHTFAILNDLKLGWYMDESEATRIAPDQRDYREDFDENRDRFGFSQRPGSLRRSFDSLLDDSRNYGADVELPWQPVDALAFTFQAGYYDLKKERESQIFRLGFRDFGSLVGIEERFLPTLEDVFSEDLIAPTGWEIESATRATDNYLANQDVKAHYFAINTTLFDEFKLYLGARDESSVQEAITFDPFIAGAQPIVATLETGDIYPAGTFTWEYNDSSQIRLAYAETLSRPDLRELSPAPFRDPILDLIVIGNPNLVATDIEHIDLRWEKYFSPSESISIALFQKEFTNPIERVINAGAAETGTFANALAATNRGVEFDFYKGLGFAWERLESFYLAGNFTYIESDITLDPIAAGNLTSQTRPLQGQSDIIANLQLGYDDPDGVIKATFLVNHTGERISDVGVQGIPDQIEQPFTQVDFVYSQKFFDENLSIKFKLKNLLDDDVQFQQGGEIARTYTRGREASVSFEYRLQ